MLSKTVKRGIIVRAVEEDDSHIAVGPNVDNILPRSKEEPLLDLDSDSSVRVLKPVQYLSDVVTQVVPVIGEHRDELVVWSPNPIIVPYMDRQLGDPDGGVAKPFIVEVLPHTL